MVPAHFGTCAKQILRHAVEGVVPDPGEHDAVGGSREICGMIEVYSLWDEDRQLHAFQPRSARHFETDGKLKAAEREMMGRIHS